MARVGGLALAAACAGALLIPAPASAGPNHPYCTNVQLTLGTCTPPPAPAPVSAVDPGGNENVDVPVPAAGKAFGFSNNLHRHQSVTPEQAAPIVKQAGVNAERISIGWQWMQYSPSNPPLTTTGSGDAALNLQWLDRRYNALVNAGIKPILLVVSAPVWSSRFAKPCPATELNCPRWKTNSDNWDGGSGDPYAGYYFPDASDPVMLDHYKKFHLALADRYPLADFEGWNEPNLYYDTEDEGREYEPWAPSPEDMTKIQCAAYTAVKAKYPARRFIGPSFLDLGWNFRDYVNRVFHAGGKSCWDGFTTHVYHRAQISFGAGTAVARALADVRSMKSFHGDADPIWITESGWPTGGTTGFDLAVTEPDQALGAGRLYNRLMSMPDVGGLFFHTLRDGRSTVFPEDHVENYYGFVRGDEASTKKDAFCVFNVRARQSNANIGQYPGC